MLCITHTHTHTCIQASELSEIVGKAFKATFAKQTLTRDKKKKKEKSGGGGGSSSSGGSSSPWTVVNHSQPSSSGSTGATSSENSAPTPSAPPVQRQPWTVQVQQGLIQVFFKGGRWLGHNIQVTAGYRIRRPDGLVYTIISSEMSSPLATVSCPVV